MQKKTIQKNLQMKMNQWLDTISDESLRNSVRKNILVSGGAIASMFLNEDINDYDVYIKDMDVLKSLCAYYAKDFKIEILDGRESYEEQGADDEDKGERVVAIRTLKKDQIKLYTSSGGKAVNKDKEKLNYDPIFFSPNAISLSNDLQIVCRFHGDNVQIHKTFDFIHATNYFTFEDGLVTNKDALESLICKQLRYQGSLYPLTSIIRMKKFIKRGWNITAGEMLKSMFQISELDLHNPDTLEEQLIGVDVAYFGELIKVLRNKDNKDYSSSFINKLIDKVFNEIDSDEIK